MAKKRASLLICPKCESDDIVHQGIQQFSLETYFDYFTCEWCGARWAEAYEHSYTDLMEED